MSFPPTSSFSASKKKTLQQVYKHLYPGRISKMHAGGIDLVIGKREGYRIWDVDGRELLDLHLNGGTFNLGHQNPKLIETLTSGLKDWDIGNHHFPSEPKGKLAEALIRSCPGDMQYVVLTSSGSEAIDVAIKSARRTTGRRKIVSLNIGYHGRTGFSGASGNAETARFFASDYPDEFISIAFNDKTALGEALSGNDIALVIMEVLPATFGFPVPNADYFPKVKSLCEQSGSLFLVDEVQTGLGRSGKAWAIEHWDVKPDMLVTGKGLSGGIYPISALVMTAECGSWLKENGWGHVSTFGGSDLGCLVALEALRISTSAKTLKNVVKQAEYLRLGLEKLKRRFPFFEDINQLGLIMGLKFSDSAVGYGMMRALYENGVWAIVAGFDESVIQFKPGLLVDRKYCDVLLGRVENACIWLLNNMNMLLMGGTPAEDDPVIVSAKALAKEALSEWGLEHAQIELVKHRENTVFKITSQKKLQYALRVHRQGYHTSAQLQSEIDWMRALDKEGLETPAILPTNDGKDFVRLRDKTTQDTWKISMLEWIPGKPFDNLGRVEKGVEYELKTRYRQLGALAGKLHNQSEAWPLPPNFNRQAWDMNGLLGEEPLWGKFWEHKVLTLKQRKLILKARIVLQGMLKQLGTHPSHYGLIHADFLPENILVEDGRLKLIDFDDCGFGWHLFEMATSLFPHVNQTFFDDIASEYVAGYRSERPLSEEHLELLPAFIMIRGFTYLGWLNTRAGSLQNGDKIAREIAQALCEFVPELLGHLTPIERLGVETISFFQNRTLPRK